MVGGRKQVMVVKVVHSLLIKDEKVLLIFKESRQKWFLPGGKSEFGESVLQTGLREFLEETGLRLDQAKLGAVTNVVIEEDNKEWMLFTVVGTQCSGELLEHSREGRLAWHPIGALHSLPMFEGDRFIITQLVKDEQTAPIVSAQYYTPSYELQRIER